MGALYSEKLLDHFRNPRNAGELPPPAVAVETSNAACGDILRLTAKLEDGRIAAVAFQVRGCTASIAAGSALTEWMLGKSAQELSLLSSGVIEDALGGLPPESKHAARLATDGANAMARTLTAAS